MTNNERDMFIVACEPLIAFMHKYGHPHMKAIVCDNGAELVEGLIAMTTEVYVKDAE